MRFLYLAILGVLHLGVMRNDHGMYRIYDWLVPTSRLQIAFHGPHGSTDGIPKLRSVTKVVSRWMKPDFEQYRLLGSLDTVLQHGSMNMHLQRRASRSSNPARNHTPLYVKLEAIGINEGMRANECCGVAIQVPR